MNILKTLLLSFSLYFSLGIWSPKSAMADYGQFQSVSISSAFIVGNSETQTIWLQGSRHIRNIIVQAQGTNQDSMVEVMVNGEIKGTIYAPGRDPSYYQE